MNCSVLKSPMGEHNLPKFRGILPQFVFELFHNNNISDIVLVTHICRFVLSENIGECWSFTSVQCPHICVLYSSVKSLGDTRTNKLPKCLLPN